VFSGSQLGAVIPRPTRQAVLAARAALQAGAARAVHTIDLSEWEPGPIEVEISPDGTTAVVAANSFSLDVTLVDTGDPSAPAVIDRFEVAGGFPYGVTYMPGRNQILAPTGTGSNLVTIDRDGDLLTPWLPVMLPGREFPLTAAVDAEESFAFVAHIVEKELSIIDLESGAIRSVSWLAGPGPSYVAVQP